MADALTSLSDAARTDGEREMYCHSFWSLSLSARSNIEWPRNRIEWPKVCEPSLLRGTLCLLAVHGPLVDLTLLLQSQTQQFGEGGIGKGAFA